jgi:hypothetical protein
MGITSATNWVMSEKRRKPPMNGKIQYAGTFALAAILTTGAAFGVAGAANAASMHMKTAPVADAAFVADDSATASAIHNWNGAPVDVLKSWDMDKATAAEVADQARLQPQLVTGLRADIRSNPALVKKLQMQNVNIDNIDGAQNSLTGGIVFYQL